MSTENQSADQQQDKQQDQQPDEQQLANPEPKTDEHPTGYTPTTEITLSWPTFYDAATEAGMSRRYGGIHFKSGDEHGRMLGSQVASFVYSKAQNYITGRTPG